MEVWLAEYVDWEEYVLIGIRFTELDAFLDCIEHHKKRRDHDRELFNSKDKWDKFNRVDTIKKIKNYTIRTYQIKNRAKKAYLIK